MLLGMKESYKKGESDSILALSLAAGNGATAIPKRARRGKPRMQATEKPTGYRASARPYHRISRLIQVGERFKLPLMFEATNVFNYDILQGSTPRITSQYTTVL